MPPIVVFVDINDRLLKDFGMTAFRTYSLTDQKKSRGSGSESEIATELTVAGEKSWRSQSIESFFTLNNPIASGQKSAFCRSG